MSDEINELIGEWKDKLGECANVDCLTVEGQKNIVRKELINRFIDQLRYLRDDV